MIEIKRIAAACSNVGIATVVRVDPLIADHEHLYYANLRAGQDERYNASLQAARDLYLSRLEENSVI